MPAASISTGDDRAGSVAARLHALLGGEITELRRLSGGASRESWAFDLVEPDRRRRLVLQADRVEPAAIGALGPRPPQARLLEAAAEAGVPVPAVIEAGEGDSVLGPSWMVVERLEGTSRPGAILAGEGVPEPRALLGELAAAVAAIHRIDVEEGSVRPLGDPLAFLRAISDGLDQPHPTFELAFRELEASRPASEPSSFVHGDFRLGNLLVGRDGLAAVLDWELAHLGDPLEDLGWLCVRAWRFDRPDQPAAGLGSREALLAAYERHAGLAVDPEALRWWELFGTLRWGLICVMQAFTHLSGASPSLEHAVIGRRACEVEWDLLELLDPDGDPGACDPEPPPGVAGEPPALHGRPTAAELLDAVRGALGDNLLPQLGGRASFELRVALRALGIVERELRHGSIHRALHAEALRRLGVADEAGLAAAVRSGSFDASPAELRAGLRTIVRAKLEAANPRHLEQTATDQEEAP